MLRELIFKMARALGALVPLPLLSALLWPMAFARALADPLRRPGRRPPHSLPPPAVVGRRWSVAGMRERTAAWLNTAALLWADGFSTPRWRRRFDLGDVEELRRLAAERPVLLVTLHYGGVFMLPALLRACGIPTASVVGAKLWPIRWWRNRRAELTRIGDVPMHFRAGDARAIVHYMVPGRCLLVAVDYPFGEQVTTDFDGRAMALSTPPFRLARITDSAVAPVIVRADGVWRFKVVVGRPVPDDLIKADEDEAIAAHIVQQLLPVAAERPEQALPLLVAAFQPAAEV